MRNLSIFPLVLGGGNSRLLDRPETVEILGNHRWFSDTYNNRIVLYSMALS